MTAAPLTRVGKGLQAACRALLDAEVRFALVGGLAVGLRVEPRFTRDVDLAVAVESDEAAERLVFLLSKSRFSVAATVEHEVRHRFATARLLGPGAGKPRVVVDLLFASSGIETEIVKAAEPMEVLPGLVVPVATTGHLIALKVLARDDVKRPQDIIDLRHLIEVADDRELKRAREAVALIAARGYHRDRPLVAQLETLLSESGR